MGVETTYNSNEPSQQWLADQNYSKSALTTHLGDLNAPKASHVRGHNSIIKKKSRSIKRHSHLAQICPKKSLQTLDGSNTGYLVRYRQVGLDRLSLPINKKKYLKTVLYLLNSFLRINFIWSDIWRCDPKKQKARTNDICVMFVTIVRIAGKADILSRLH